MAEPRAARRPHAAHRRGHVEARLVLAVESVRCVCGRLILLSRVRGSLAYARLAGFCAGCHRGATLHVEIESARSAR